MIKLLEHTRRPDISFHHNGTIRISARVACALSLQSGDAVNIAVSGESSSRAEYLLHAVHRNAHLGRCHAQCYPTRPGSRNFRANSVQLCRSLFAAVGIAAGSVAFMTGEAVTKGDVVYIPIITRSPIWIKK